MTSCFKKLRSGAYVDLLAPNPNDIQLTDIAYSLSNQCRYSGNVPFYSVAEHSIIAAHLSMIDGCSIDQIKAVLLHDASECVTGDISSPVKEYVRILGSSAIDDLMASWDCAVGRRFCVDLKANHDVIKFYDNILLKAEKKRFWPDDTSNWPELCSIENRKVNWLCLGPDDGAWFMSTASFLGIG